MLTLIVENFAQPDIRGGTTGAVQLKQLASAYNVGGGRIISLIIRPRPTTLQS